MHGYSNMHLWIQKGQKLLLNNLNVKCVVFIINIFINSKMIKIAFEILNIKCTVFQAKIYEFKNDKNCLWNM